MRGLAQIGIIALVDEATGYQRDREKDALARILCPPIGKPTQLAFEYADEDAEDTGKGL